MTSGVREMSLDDLEWSSGDKAPPTTPKKSSTPRKTGFRESVAKVVPLTPKAVPRAPSPVPSEEDTLSDSDDTFFDPGVLESPMRLVPKKYPKPMFTPIATKIEKKHHGSRAPVKKKRFNLTEYLKMIGLGTGSPGMATGLDLAWRGMSRKRQRKFIR